MYRRAIMMEQERMQEERFVSRLGNLPVVSSAWTQACNMYQKTKDSSAILKATCDMAEGGVQTVVSSAMPYVEKYSPQLEKVNSFACEKLTQVEEQYPVITRPTEELWEQGKEKCAGVIKPVTSTVSAVCDSYNGLKSRGQNTIEATKERVENVKESVKDYGMLQVHRTLETPLGQYAMEKVNEALAVSEDYVEKYLPASEEEEGEDEKAPVEVDEASTYTRVTSLSGKLRRRMYKRALKDLRGLQLRSKEKMERLNFTVDLIQYAKSQGQGVKDTVEEKYEVAQQKLAQYWEQINQEEPEGEETPQTVEGKTLALARRATRQVKQGLTTVSGYIPTRLQPAVVRERMEHAMRYSEELYQSFKKAQGFDDLPHWLLSQAKEKMAYVQETVSFLADTFLVGPISWLRSRAAVEPGTGEGSPRRPVELEMEPIPSGHE